MSGVEEGWLDCCEGSLQMSLFNSNFLVSTTLFVTVHCMLNRGPIGKRLEKAWLMLERALVWTCFNACSTERPQKCLKAL